MSAPSTPGDEQPPDTTLRTPARIWGAEARAFMPVPPTLVRPRRDAPSVAAPDTTVKITSAAASTIELVLTFSPLTSAPSGVPRVAALQTVYSSVSINFTTQATLCWLVSVLTAGELSPNQAAQVFGSNSDAFSLPVTETITVTHDAGGWTLPSYSDQEYTVNVGFGLQISDWVYWAYSAVGTPRQQLALTAGSYELVRSNGAEQIGSPVFLSGMSQWLMPIGHGYALDFDASGDGVLSVA